MDFVEQLKSSIDIVKVVGEYVRLRRVGSTGRYLGLCPFHQEKTPSFNVHQSRQFYKCFGCGAGGDALKFVMEVDGLTFLSGIRRFPKWKNLPVIMFTGLKDRNHLMKAQTLGVKEYLVKSEYTMQDLVALIRKHLQPSPAAGGGMDMPLGGTTMSGAVS